MKFDPKEGCLVIAVQRGVGLPEHQIKGPPGKLKGLLNTLSIYRFRVSCSLYNIYIHEVFSPYFLRNPIAIHSSSIGRNIIISSGYFLNENFSMN